MIDQPTLHEPLSGTVQVQQVELRQPELTLRIEIARTRISLLDAARLRDGAVIQLASPVSDPVDLYHDDRLIARGEIVVVDEKLAVRVTEIVQDTPSEGT